MNSDIAFCLLILGSTGLLSSGCHLVLGIEDTSLHNAELDDRARDAGTENTDSEPPSTDGGIVNDIAHLPLQAGFTGNHELTVSVDMFVDTTSLTIDGRVYPGDNGDPIVFDSWPQEPRGPDLAVLHIGTLSVSQEATIRISGSRPLLVISEGGIVIDGLIDIGGHGNEPGAGGAHAGFGSGAGEDGKSSTNAADSGGGGAGSLSQGARGGNACIPPDIICAAGGNGGSAYGDTTLTVLTGGSGGGSGGSAEGNGCPPGIGGAGGGAIQLTSMTSIHITASGKIQAGGGGGGGGILGDSSCNTSGGGGGGSGGAVFLEAPDILHQGVMAANGGGGGSAPVFSAGLQGFPGEDGRLGSTPAAGGDAPMSNQDGGSGGADRTTPTAAMDVGNGNSGGGGASAGRLVVSHPPDGSFVQDEGITSPGVIISNTSNIGR